MPKIEIRQGEPSDLDGLERLYNDLHDHLSAGENHPGWIKGYYKGVNDQYLAVIHIDTPFCPKVGVLRMVIEDDGPRDLPIDISNIQIVFREAFFGRFAHRVVHPGFSGKGVGRSLLDFSVQLARKTGIKAIRLDVYRKNTPAIGLYEKCGFRYVDTVDLGLAGHGLDFFRLYEKVL